MKERKFGKTYLAIIEGVPEVAHGVINAPIVREYEGSIKRVVRNDGKECITEYELVESYDNGTSLVKVTPHTGRTHQIRVHMAHIGHPLVDDFLYGTRGEETYSLHCSSLSFPHPFTGETIVINAEYPK